MWPVDVREARHWFRIEDVDQRINSPYWQPGPLGFAAICLVGVAYAVNALVTLQVGTEPWWVGVMALGLILPSFVFIEGGWLWIQREVDLADGTIRVSRWLTVLRGRRGPSIPLDARTRIAIVTDSGRWLRIERDGVVTVNATLLYWDASKLRALLDALHDKGVEISKPWDGGYPPWAT